MQPDLFADPVSVIDAPTEPSAEQQARTDPRDQPADETSLKSQFVVSNLAEALACYEDAASDHRYRANIRSAFRNISRCLNLPLQQIPVEPQKLRPLLAKAKPAAVGLKPRNWIVLKSYAARGLRDLGVAVRPARDETPLAPEWQALLSGLAEQRFRIGLSRLLRCFTRNEVKPDSVTKDDFDSFRRELAEGALMGSPESAYRQAVRLWNDAVRLSASWPQINLPVPRDARQFSFDWTDFPPSFVSELGEFLTSKSQSDPLRDDYSRPVREHTTRGRRKSLRVIASALVLSETVPIEAVTGLRVLTELEHVRSVLRFLRDRAGGKVTEGHISHAYLLRTIARHWLKDEALACDITSLISNLSVHTGAAGKGITERNRDKLRQFDEPSSIERLVALPQKILNAIDRKSDLTHSDSVHLMYALQVGILTFIPMRSGNLVELRLGENLIDVGKGPNRQVRIHLPASITKTYRDYEAPMPAHLYPLLDVWLSTHRARVCAFESPYLFPNSRGELRSRDSLACKLTNFIKRETGLEVHLHLFRHLAAKIYLRHDPSGIEIVRQLLGHTNTRTTLRAYAELVADPAFKRMEKALLERGAPNVAPKKRTRGDRK